MAQLPPDQAINRFKENEDRFDKFVNDATGYVSSGGATVESLQEFLARAEQTVAAYGGQRPFATRADLDAYAGGDKSQFVAAVLNDSTTANNGWYRWNGSAWVKSNYDPAAMVSTAKAEALAAAATDATTKANAAQAAAIAAAAADASTMLAPSMAGNLADTLLTGAYIRNDGLIVAEANSVICVIPVTRGRTYAIKCPAGFGAGYFFAGMSASATPVAGQSVSLVSATATSDNLVKTMTIPSNAAAYLFFNAKVGASWDTRTGLIVNEGVTATDTSAKSATMTMVNNAPVVDESARTRISALETAPQLGTPTIIKHGNLYDAANSVSGFYCVSGSTGFSANADSIVAVIAIEAGKTYAIKTGSYSTGYFAAMLKTDNVVGSGTGTNVTASLQTTADPTVKTLAIASGSTAKYLMLNAKVGTSFDIRSGLVVNEGTSITDSGPYTIDLVKIGSAGIRDDVARAAAATAQAAVNASIQSPLKGKKWVAIGDSITEVNFRTGKNYHGFVSDNVGGMTIYNYGQAGTGYYGRFNVAGTISDDPDYVTVFFGTNDWNNSDPNNTKSLGAFGDTANTTIAGCIYLTLSQLITKFYSKKIAVFTPLPRSDNYGSLATANSRGFTLEQLSDVISKTAAHFSLPCLDLYHTAQLPVWTTAGNAFYFTAPGQSSPDGLHPNDAGHAKIAQQIQRFMERM